MCPQLSGVECNNHGTCSQSLKACQCDQGYGGSNCANINEVSSPLFRYLLLTSFSAPVHVLQELASILTEAIIVSSIRYVFLNLLYFITLYHRVLLTLAVTGPLLVWSRWPSPVQATRTWVSLSCWIYFVLLTSSTGPFTAQLLNYDTSAVVQSWSQTSVNPFIFFFSR